MWKTTEVVIGDNEANEMRESANMVVNRIKTVGTCKLRIENIYGRKQNKALSDILSPHIPYKNLEYE